MCDCKYRLTTLISLHPPTDSQYTPHIPQPSPTAVHITTAAGRRYRARCAIITLPVPLLRSSSSSASIVFDPPLPPTKLSALGRIRMGLFNKVRSDIRALRYNSGRRDRLAVQREQINPICIHTPLSHPQTETKPTPFTPHSHLQTNNE